jgi:prepilin-type N-terminal cleavage/methylation domain-containing protein
MSKIGNKGFLRLEMLFHKKTQQGFRKGFTLLEVMITAAVLALGATLIYQSFFIAVDSFNYYSTILKVTPWMDEKIWQAQNDLKHLGAAAATPAGGQLEVNSKSINWGLAYHSLDQTNGLYAVDLAASWPQGVRQVKLSRSAYAIHPEK